MLPIEAVLGELRAALRDSGVAVVHAPPGAGKTTLVPLAMRVEPWLGADRIVMLEPRRLAARAAAHRMASLLGQSVGGVVGYRTRLDTRVGPGTRIEVVTEGVLTRMLHSDPTLDGYGAVIFDEFHERSVQADLGMALVLHTRALVRPDLRIVAMSATFDGTAVAGLMGSAPIVRAHGRQFDVETRYRPAPIGSRLGRLDDHFVARVVRDALDESAGDVLVFLPGAPEISRVLAALVAASLPPAVSILPLHGSMSPEQQDQAIAPAPPGSRKVVLATSIAETSLTIEGIRVVVDGGLARRARFSPRTGMSRLETLRVSQAAADQRRGRAGRVSSGVCYRLWSPDDVLQPFAPPEIAEADLVPLALDLAAAGVVDPSELRWLDLPPPAAYAQARELLRELEALDDAGRITAHGRAIADGGMHPRLAHMVARAGEIGSVATACDLAAILTERDPLRGTGVDVHARLDAVRNPAAFPDVSRGALHRIRDQARLWRSRMHAATPDGSGSDPGRLLALAYPDRVARRRPGPAARYVLRNGTGAVLPEGDALSRDPYLVVAESDGRSPESRIHLAASLTESDVETLFAPQIIVERHVAWSDEHGVRATIERRLGAIVLTRSADPHPDTDAVAMAIAAALARNGLGALPWNARSHQLRQRLAFLHEHDPAWPAMSDTVLLDTLVSAMREELGRVRSRDALQRIDVAGALLGLLTWAQRRELDELAPTHFETPTGSRLAIDYSNHRAPTVSVRLQEMFGTRETPALLGGRVPLTFELLSPAQRPVQVTRDLAGFWRSSYHDVRKELRARYPRHEWPEDPQNASPVSRVRPRR